MSKSVKVRIAVAVNDAGEWSATGGIYDHDDLATGYSMEALMNESKHGGDPVLVHWVTADVPIPTPQEVAGDVEVKG